MSKSKNSAANVENVERTPEQNANVETLNTAAAPAPEKTEPTLADLQKVKTDAIAHAMEIENGEKSTDVEKSKAWDAVRLASNAINAFNAKAEKAKLEREIAEKTEMAKNDIIDSFGITAAKFDELLESDTLRASFALVFGKPAIVAKEGQTGKSLVGEKKHAGKSADIMTDLASGITYDELLAKYPTAGDPTKLNGTARTVISMGGWKKQSDGTYKQG